MNQKGAWGITEQQTNTGSVLHYNYDGVSAYQRIHYDTKIKREVIKWGSSALFMPLELCEAIALTPR